MEMSAHPAHEVPLLRGVLHAVSCPVALACGGVLAWMAPTTRASLALLVMSVGFALVFGTSGAYHRVRWSPTARRWARRADHAMIFVVLATTYTAVWIAALDGWVSDVVLAFAWLAAVGGILLKLRYHDARPSRNFIAYLCIGLAGLLVVPTVWRTMGAVPLVLMLAGGAATALGGVAYATGRPNPHPRWFGHHEVFHAGTIIGCAFYIGALAHFSLR